MIRFLKSIIFDVITTIINMYWGTISSFSNGYCISNIRSRHFSCHTLLIRPYIKRRILHINIYKGNFDIPTTNIQKEHKYPSSTLDLINSAIKNIIRNRLLITGDKLSIKNSNQNYHIRNILYNNGIIGARKISIENGYRIYITKASFDITSLHAQSITAIWKPSISTSSTSSYSLPITIQTNIAKIILIGRPNITINATNLHLNDHVKYEYARCIIHKYTLLTTRDLDIIPNSRIINLEHIECSITNRISLLINRLLVRLYPSGKKKKQMRLNKIEQNSAIHINHDFLNNFEHQDTSSLETSSSILKTQITMIDQYIDANPYQSYLPIVDKSIKNSELYIGNITIRWKSGDWYISRLRIIDQQESTYIETYDYSIHHPGTFHLSRKPNTDKCFVVRMRKTNNQVVISPSPIYINTDISATLFPEIDIIKSIFDGVEGGASSIYTYLCIEGFQLIVNIRSDISIGSIDIRDAELQIGEWQIWSPANMTEITRKYENHIREQIYRDINMKALLGRSPLSAVGSIMSIVEMIKGWGL